MGTEPIFEDIASELDIDDDVKQLAKQYSMLGDANRELVKKMINSLAEKIEKINPVNGKNDAETSPYLQFFKSPVLQDKIPAFTQNKPFIPRTKKSKHLGH